MQAFADGSLTAPSIVLWTLLSLAAAIGGGAMAGVMLGGKDLGNALAALMGAMYGPVAAVPGILVGLMIVAFT